MTDRDDTLAFDNADPSDIDKSMLGAAGEHYVMSQLLRRGMIAALAPARAPLVDILIYDQSSSICAALQVKTCRNALGWRMHKKHEEHRSELFYAFVSFEGDGSVRCWLMPSKVAADVMRASSDAWMARPARDGSKHNPSDLRWVRLHHRHELPGYGREWMSPYHEAWNLLSRYSATN